MRPINSQSVVVAFCICLAFICGCRQTSPSVLGEWIYPTPDDQLVFGFQHYSQRLTFKANKEFELKETYFSTGRSYVGKYTVSDGVIELQFIGHGHESLTGMRIGSLPISNQLSFQYAQRTNSVLELMPMWNNVNDSDSQFVSPSNFMSARKFRRLTRQ